MAAPTSTIARRICTRTGSSQLLDTAACAASGGRRVPAFRRAESNGRRWFAARVYAATVMERRDMMGLRGMLGMRNSYNTSFSTSAATASTEEENGKSSSSVDSISTTTTTTSSTTTSTSNPPPDLKDTTSSPESTPLQPPTHLDAAESQIFTKLAAGLSPKSLVVKDISGGCGSMYAIEVSSEKFRGLSVLKQQRLVNEVLGRELVMGWHGVQIKTSVPG